MKKILAALLILGAGVVSAQTKHELTPLPYPVDALEPVMSAETLEYHHGKHVQAYVNKLNELIPGTEFANKSIEEITYEAQGAIFDNAAQIYNHMLFFDSFAPESSAKHAPTGALAAAIERDFGSFEFFKKEFEDAAAALFGSGWTWLAVGPEEKLTIYSLQNAGNPLRDGYKPLLGVDVWEHSYYIDYRNRRTDYLKDLWRIINWEAIEKRYE